MKANRLKKINTLLFTLTFTSIFSQNQIGIDIDGSAAQDESGYSISMPEPDFIAVGSPYNDGSGQDAGQVRIYSWNGMNWVQFGEILGESPYDYSGFSVSMPNPLVVGVGAPNNDGNGVDAGHARVYLWNGFSWVQKGQDIDGETASDQSGKAISMPDSNTIAVGAPNNDGNGVDAGHVRVYSWNGTSWVQKGQDIDGEAASDESGKAISMPDSNTIAIGAALNDGNGTSSGHVRVYFWNGTTWVQKGQDIDGEAAYDYAGFSVSMPDSNTVAVGASLNDGGGFNSGHVRIYSWNGTAWIQKGQDIDGEASGDEFGFSVSMADTNTVAIGAIRNDGTAAEAGHVRIYTWNGSNWVQLGQDIDGEIIYDWSGYSVSMADANTVAVGAPSNGGNGTDAGHVRIYNLNNTTNIVSESIENEDRIMVYPNPTTTGNIVIAFPENNIYNNITLKNVLGQILYHKSFSFDERNISIDIQGEKGYYSLELFNRKGDKTTLKILKN